MVRLRTIGPQCGSYRSNTCLSFSAVGSYVVVLRAVAADPDAFINIFRFRSTKALFSNLYMHIYKIYRKMQSIMTCSCRQMHNAPCFQRKNILIKYIYINIHIKKKKYIYI